METILENQRSKTSNSEIQLNQICNVQVTIGNNIRYLPATINAIIKQQNNTQYLIKFSNDQDVLNECFLVKKDHIQFPEILTNTNLELNTQVHVVKILGDQENLNDLELKSKSAASSTTVSNGQLKKASGLLSKKDKSSENKKKVVRRLSLLAHQIKREKRVPKQKFDKSFDYYDKLKKRSKLKKSDINENINCWKVDDFIAVRENNAFYKGKILALRTDQLKIHFIGWNSRFDKWFNFDDKNLKEVSQVSSFKT